MRAVYSVIKGPLTIQQHTFYPVVGSVQIPDLLTLHEKSREELTVLRPTHVNMVNRFAAFGLTMSNGVTV
jgi:hypothetical protein